MARIMVVDDDPEFLTMMDEVLELLGHHGLTLPARGISIDQIADAGPELLIVGGLLSGGSADQRWEPLLRMRTHPRLASIPIVLSTGDHNFLREREHAIRALPDFHVLPKPFGMAELEGVLDELLASRPD